MIFGIWASELPPGPGERLKRPGLIGLSVVYLYEFGYLRIRRTQTGISLLVNFCSFIHRGHRLD